METEGFAVFILTHGRPDRVRTYRTLRRQGYTGPIYLVVDNEDKTLDQYKATYGDQVIVFDKLAAAQCVDAGDNFDDRRTVLYARNECFRIARELGLTYFLELDDDYSTLVHKFTPDLVYRERASKNLDGLFAAVLDFFKSIPATTIALGQNGDFIGGGKGSAGSKLWLKRKAMNSFFCSVDRPFSFLGRFNDDVNTYVVLGNRGDLFLTVFNASVIQEDTQKSPGGLTELYLDYGTYVKSFYTVMYAPSCVKVAEIGVLHRRIHHKINWPTAVPCILSEQYRKRSQGLPDGS